MGNYKFSDLAGLGITVASSVQRTVIIQSILEQELFKKRQASLRSVFYILFWPS